MPITKNTQYYPRAPFERSPEDLHRDIFVVEVLTVDYERKVMTVSDIRDGLVYSDVQVFPASSASQQGYEMVMPEQGSIGLACNFAYSSGFRQTMIIGWVHLQRYIGVDAIGVRPISGARIQGHSDRLRGTYRKATPGQKTSSYTGGFSEKIDTGWDRQTAAYSRDKEDSDKRQWTTIAERKVSYTDAGAS